MKPDRSISSPGEKPNCCLISATMRTLNITGTGSSCNIGPTDNNMYTEESLVDLSSTVSPCSYPSHSFSGSWECNELDANNQITNSVFVQNGQIKMPAANVQCSPVWDAIIGLLWKSLTNASPTTPVTVTSNQSTCIYGRDNDITPIAPPPARTGYTFKGWKVTSHQQ